MYCAIDFGTSNSAVAVPDAARGMRLVELEPGHTTMPTAVFYFVEGPEHDGPPRAFGRAAATFERLGIRIEPAAESTDEDA